MSNSISLTASMRSNLLSLQNIAGQVDLTQNRLSTGLKVNSAIDNPSSYYTAVSLNNRANDLSTLLDGMSQAIQTIKAATEALQSATSFLSQAVSVASQALEKVEIPGKSYFEQQEGVAAVVATKDELLAAINSGKKGDIVIYGQIDMGNTTITLKEGQNIKGVGAYGVKDKEMNKFSKLSFELDDSSTGTAITYNNGATISDLSLALTSERSNQSYLVRGTSAADATASVSNMDVVIDASGNVNVFDSYVGKIDYSGKIAIRDLDKSYGSNTIYHNAFVGAGTLTEVTVNADLGKTRFFHGKEFSVYDSQINLQSDYGQLGVPTHTGDKVHFYGSSSINLQGKELYSGDVILHDDVVLNLKNSGSWTVVNESIELNDRANYNVYNGGSEQGGSLFGVTLTINSADARFSSNSFRVIANCKFSFAAGASMVLSSGRYTANSDIADLTASTGWESNFTVDASVKPSFDHASFDRVFEDFMTEDEELSEKADASQYQEIIKQYDSLIKDSSYKGINLLNGQDLSIVFNEDRSSGLFIGGKDASAKALGIVTLEWHNLEDVQSSLDELNEALGTIRSLSEELGSYYSIVTTRESFTSSLINVLTEGADKLTLADMNQESANMLALQTRQQLAVNSLSLASQASQSILKLF